MSQLFRSSKGNQKRFKLSRVKLVRKLPGEELKKVQISGRFELLCSSRKYPYPLHGRSNGNSEGVGRRLKRQDFKRAVWGLTGISRGVGGFIPKNLLWEGYGYFLEQHIEGLSDRDSTVLGFH